MIIIIHNTPLKLAEGVGIEPKPRRIESVSNRSHRPLWTTFLNYVAPLIDMDCYSVELHELLKQHATLHHFENAPNHHVVAALPSDLATVHVSIYQC